MINGLFNLTCEKSDSGEVNPFREAVEVIQVLGFRDDCVFLEVPAC
jgi:hypothetical protein